LHWISDFRELVEHIECKIYNLPKIQDIKQHKIELLSLPLLAMWKLVLVDHPMPTQDMPGFNNVIHHFIEAHAMDNFMNYWIVSGRLKYMFREHADLFLSSLPAL
jgi:hypothetical protein